jgi:CheY-like chemotaxis protein
VSEKNTVSALRDIAQNMSVLYAEDDAQQRASVMTTLKKLFGEVVAVEDGALALDRFRSRGFDLVLSDIRMPNLDGLGLLKAIKTINADQIVVVISAHEESSYLLELINLGADGFMTKPVKNDHFIQTLYKMVRIIDDRRMLEAYRDRLEESNLALSRTIDDLKEAQRAGDRLRIENILLSDRQEQALDAIEERADGMSEETLQQLLRTSFHHKVHAKDYVTFDVENKVEDIETLEGRINQALTQEAIDPIIALTFQYGEIFNRMPDFTHMGYVFEKLAELIEGHYEEGHKKAFINLYSCLIDDLGRWREEVLLHQSAVDIHYLDASIINSYLAIRKIFIPEPEWADSENELELF